MLGVSTAFAKTFNDVNKVDPNFVAIDYLSSKDVLKGYADGNFKPDQLVNRAPYFRSSNPAPIKATKYAAIELSPCTKHELLRFGNKFGFI